MLTMTLSGIGVLVAPLVVYALGAAAIVSLGALVALVCHVWRDWL